MNKTSQYDQLSRFSRLVVQLEQAVAQKHMLLVIQARTPKQQAHRKCPLEHELADRRRGKPREPVRIRMDPILHSPPPIGHNLEDTCFTKVIQTADFSLNLLFLDGGTKPYPDLSLESSTKSRTFTCCYLPSVNSCRVLSFSQRGLLNLCPSPQTLNLGTLNSSPPQPPGAQAFPPKRWFRFTTAIH